jgi:hypothetical protein
MTLTWGYPWQWGCRLPWSGVQHAGGTVGGESVGDSVDVDPTIRVRRTERLVDQNRSPFGSFSWAGSANLWVEPNHAHLYARRSSTASPSTLALCLGVFHLEWLRT